MISHARTLRVAQLVGAAGVALTIAACRNDCAPAGKTPPAAPAAHAPETGGMSAMPGMANMPDMGSSRADSGFVRLSAAQVRQLGITFGTVAVRPLAADIRATGVIVVDERRVAQIAPKFDGIVERLDVNATGQIVRRGDPLLDIYSPDVLAAEQDLLAAAGSQQAVDASDVPGVPAGTGDLVAGARRRLSLLDISDAQIEATLRTGRAPRTVTLYSPADGVVIDKRVVQGQAVAAGQDLYTIADLSDVWVDVQFRASDAGVARAGAPVDIAVVGLPNWRFEGRLASVYPMLDTAARAIRARVTVPNPHGALKLGMYATVRIRTGGGAVVTVPSSAVLRTGERTLVFVDQGGGRFAPTAIRIGRTGGDYTEVLSGLEPGQRVVTSAQFLLDSEANLDHVMRSMIGQAPGEMTP